MISLPPYSLIAHSFLIIFYYATNLALMWFLRPVVKVVPVNNNTNISITVTDQPILSSRSIIKSDVMYSWRNKKEIRASIDVIQLWTQCQNVPSLIPSANFKIFFLDNKTLSRSILIQLLSENRQERLHVLIDYIYKNNTVCGYKDQKCSQLEKALCTLCVESIGNNDPAEESLVTTLLANILCISRGTHAYDFILTRLKDRIHLSSVVTSKCILRNSAVKLDTIYNFKIPKNNSSFNLRPLSCIIKSTEITKPTLVEIKNLEKYIWSIILRPDINTFEEVTKLKFDLMNIELKIRCFQKELDFQKVSNFPLKSCKKNKAIQSLVTAYRIVQAFLRETEQAYVFSQIYSFISKSSQNRNYSRGS